MGTRHLSPTRTSADEPQMFTVMERGTMKKIDDIPEKLPKFFEIIQEFKWLRRHWKQHLKMIIIGISISLSLIIIPIVWKYVDPFNKKIPILPNKSVSAVTINSPTTVKELLESNAQFDRDRRDFTNPYNFYSWLSKKPKLIIKSDLIFDDTHDLLTASSIQLEKNGKIISKHGKPIHLLTLLFTNSNGIIISDSLEGVQDLTVPNKAGQGISFNSKCHDESCNKKAFANGGSGEPGKTGKPGGIGGVGGKLVLAAATIKGPLDIKLTGGKGGTGGTGGTGGDGGNGKGGSRGDGKALNCACGGRNGGSGGNAGVGGKGGQGGQGGKGGSVLIVTTNKYSANSKINVDGGEGGEGGKAGNHGKPGKKGRGCGADLWCAKTHDGKDGEVPKPSNLGGGDKGPQGAKGHIEKIFLQLESNQPNYEGFYLWANSWNFS